MKTLDDYLASKPKMKTMIEYCVLGGVNDSEECAELLGALLRGKEVIVNLIPLNPTDTPAGHVPPKPEAVRKMLEILTKKYNLFTTIRHEMGQDIAGACGQLALKVPGEPDMEDMMAPVKRRLSGAPGKPNDRGSTRTKKSPLVTPVASRPMLSTATMERALVAAGLLSTCALMYSWYARRRAATS